MNSSISVPVKLIGPIRIIGQEVNDEVFVPLATYETPMWPSTNRGASVSRATEGIRCVILKDGMTRSVLLEGDSVQTLKAVIDDLPLRREELCAVVHSTSRFCRLIDWQTQVVGNLLYLRLSMETGDASGHNMTTKAADGVIDWLLHTYPELKYVSVSGNICIDKKVSAINGLLGRGKYVVAEILIPRAVCLERLKTTPEAIVNLNIKKNLLGSIVAGGLRTANAHYANLLYALYLATGQDVANIVEGSQGFTFAELRNENLYFSVTLPNIIVGTVGNGKHYDFVQNYLAQCGCHQLFDPTADDIIQGKNARRLAIITASTVLCGELSLMAAQTNRGELMRAHEHYERKSFLQAKLQPEDTVVVT